MYYLQHPIMVAKGFALSQKYCRALDNITLKSIFHLYVSRCSAAAVSWHPTPKPQGLRAAAEDRRALDTITTKFSFHWYVSRCSYLGTRHPSPKACVLPQKYRDALDVITQESGLPESSILDIRGNHDVFDMGQR